MAQVVKAAKTPREAQKIVLMQTQSPNESRTERFDTETELSEAARSTVDKAYENTDERVVKRPRRQ